MTRQFTRQVQVGMKIEATEGEVETLTAPDFLVNIKERAGHTYDVQRTDRQIQRATLSRNTMVIGHRGLTLTGMIELAGGTLAAPPKWHDVLQAMGFVRSANTAVKFVTLGTVTNGPFRTGQLIGNNAVFGSATKTGRVLMEHYDGTTRRLFYIPILSAFANEDTVYNYETSQASAEATAAPANGGWTFTPRSETDSVVPPSATMQFRDGVEVHHGVGMRGTGSIRFAIGETAHIDYTMQGPALLDPTRDREGPQLAGFVSMSGQTFPVAPPGIRAMPLRLRKSGSGYHAPVLPDITLNINNQVAARPNVNDSSVEESGRMAALISNREIGFTIEPEANPAAFDLIQADFAAELFEVAFAAGSPVAPGGAHVVWAPTCQVTELSQRGDRDGIRTESPTISCVGDDDNEILIAHLLIA